MTDDSVPDRGDTEITLRSARQQLRRALKQGRVAPDLREAAAVAVDIFAASAEEEALSGTGGTLACEMMVELLEAMLGEDDDG